MELGLIVRCSAFCSAALLGLVGTCRAQCPGHWSPGVSAAGVVGAPSSLNQLAALPNGDVAVSGSFTSIGGEPSFGLALYRPGANTWIALGGDPQVSWGKIAAAPDGTIVGIVAQGTSQSQVARFDPVSRALTYLPAITPSACGLALTAISVTPEGSILLGVGTECEPAVMRFEPTMGGGGGWSQVGEISGNELFAQSCGPSAMAMLTDGGVAVATNCVEMTHCCSWDASSVHVYAAGVDEWSRIYRATTGFGSTIPAPFRVLAMQPLANGDLVIGGEFVMIPPATPALRVARYSALTAAWSAIGGGLASPVLGLAVMPNGDLVARTADGLFRYRDGAAEWTRFQVPIAGTITSMVVLPQGDVLVAGYSGQFPSLSPILARSVLSSAQTACPADFSCSGGVTVDDLFLFFQAWFTDEPRADANNSGTVTFDDLFYYINAWFIGC